MEKSTKATFVSASLSLLRDLWDGIKNLSPTQRIYVALIGSLGIHFFSIFIISLPRAIRFFQKPLSQIEVTYQNIKIKDVKQNEMPPQKVNVTQEKEAPKSFKVFSKESDKLSTFKGAAKEIPKFGRRITLDEKQIPPMGTLESHRSISVSLSKVEKITNPKYLGYDNKLHDIIHRRAIFNIENLVFKRGDVYLSFVVLASGELSQVRINKEKTNAEEKLQEIALKSIQEASPFPPFPGGLQYPVLTFNVVISFEVN